MGADDALPHFTVRLPWDGLHPGLLSVVGPDKCSGGTGLSQMSAAGEKEAAGS